MKQQLASIPWLCIFYFLSGVRGLGVACESIMSFPKQLLQLMHSLSPAALESHQISFLSVRPLSMLSSAVELATAVYYKLDFPRHLILPSVGCEVSQATPTFLPTWLMSYVSFPFPTQGTALSCNNSLELSWKSFCDIMHKSLLSLPAIASL